MTNIRYGHNMSFFGTCPLFYRSSEIDQIVSCRILSFTDIRMGTGQSFGRGAAGAKVCRSGYHSDLSFDPYHIISHCHCHCHINLIISLLHRLEICCDRRDQRSCKIFVSCVNFSRKQCSFSHNLQVYTHLNVNFLHNC